MAFVVARRNRRFEVRESLHTPSGPRARSLASFDVLSDEVLTVAAARATRPFDAAAVIASGRRAGAPVTAMPGAEGVISGASGRFVQASRRMALSMRRSTSHKPADPGAALIDLMGFAEAVARSQPPRQFEPLAFPVLSRLLENRHAAMAAH